MIAIKNLNFDINNKKIGEFDCMANVWAVSCGAANEWPDLWPIWSQKEYVAIGYGVSFPLVDKEGNRLTNEDIVSNLIERLVDPRLRNEKLVNNIRQNYRREFSYNASVNDDKANEFINSFIRTTGLNVEGEIQNKINEINRVIKDINTIYSSVRYIELFAFVALENDYVVVKNGNNGVLGIAQIIGEIGYSEQTMFPGNKWHLYRKVKWIAKLEHRQDIDINPSFNRPAVQRLLVECDVSDITMTSGDNVFRQRMGTILEAFNLLDANNSETTQETNMHQKSTISPLNQILYGPPGTGKTYNTVNKAIAIANPEFILKDKITGINTPRYQVKAEFDKLVASGQIVFTTFHQSMSYEDFIEGIKPETIDGNITYQVVDGIFKKICQDALTPNVSSFNEAYEKLINKLSDESQVEIFTPKNKPFSISLNSNGNLSLHTGPNKGVQGSLTKENIQKVINNEHMFRGYEGYFIGVIQYLTDHCSYSNENESTSKNFVLIIDEINRGNVSQIFGELITLIEDDKRLGCDESLEITLPYSKKVLFGVPKNLFIIGTMNTADRSVEALDAALRRRFSFEEMPPDSKLIATDGKLKEKNGKLGEVSLPNLLDTINKRIEKLLDKDHQIGHSYLMSVESLDDLKQKFQNNIIPLLQEYFFGDYGKIGLVLGKGFVSKDDSNKNNFAAFSDTDADEFSERPIFKIINPTSNEDFIKAIESLLSNKKTNVE